MTNGAGWPMGPCALVDLVGIDVHVHASEALYEKLREPRMAPPPRLVAMKNAGLLGRKSGRGLLHVRELATVPSGRRAARRRPERRSLDDHREQHDDEDDPVDLGRVVVAADAPRARRAGSEPRPSGRPRSMNTRSPQLSRDRQQQRHDDERADDEARARRRARGPRHQVSRRRDQPRSIVRPSATNTAISAEAGERREELSISRLGGAAASPKDPGDEHGEEPGAVRERRSAVDDAGAGERRDRIERGAGSAHAPHQRRAASAPATPTASPIAISIANS